MHHPNYFYIIKKILLTACLLIIRANLSTLVSTL